MLSAQNTKIFGNCSLKSPMSEAGLAGWTDTLSFDVADGDAAGNAVAFTIKQGYFSFADMLRVTVLCLYYIAGVTNCMPKCARSPAKTIWVTEIHFSGIMKSNSSLTMNWTAIDTIAAAIQVLTFFFWRTPPYALEGIFGTYYYEDKV